MCFFLTIAVPAGCAGEFEAAIPRGLAALPCDNRSLQSQLPRDFSTFLLTSGGCSCDLFRRNSVELPSPDPERLRKRYEKRGWSAAKIERALKDASHSHRALSSFVGLRADVRDLLAELVARHGEVAVVVHFYHGDVDAERFEPLPKAHWSVAEMRSSDNAIREDEIVLLTAAR
jgi:hypothetical protein